MIFNRAGFKSSKPSPSRSQAGFRVSYRASSLGSRSGRELSTAVVSRKAYYNATATLTVTVGTGTLSKNGGTPGASVSIVPGDYVQAHVTSSASYETGVSITLSNSDTFVVTTRAEDVIIDDISFTAQFDINPSVAVESNTVTILGIDSTATLDLTVTDCEYSKNSGAFTAIAGTVALNDTVQLKATASATYEAVVTGTVDIGSVSADFDVTTRTAVTTPDAFSFTDQIDVAISTFIESDEQTLTGVEIPVSFEVTGGLLEKNNSGVWAASGAIANNDTFKAGGNSSTAYETAANVLVNISGVSDTFTLTTRAEVSQIDGDILDVAISSDGWFAEIDVDNFNISGTYDLDPDGTNLPEDMAIVFKVTSTGYDDTGTATTMTRNVYGTNYKRKIYPDSTTTDGVAQETDNTTYTTLRIALSEWIYSTDIVQLTIAEAGYYNDGTDTVLSQLIDATNNSSEPHQPCIANWSLPGFTLVGSSMELRCVAFHRSAQEGKPVKCVKFTVTDEHSNSVSTIVTDATIDDYQSSDAIPIIEYIGTIDTTDLTDGDILTANFIAYPWYGTALDTADEVNTQPTPLYAPQYYVLDKADTYGRTVAVVSTTGDDGTGAVVDYNSFDDQSPPAAFATIGAAANAIKVYNNANNGHDDTGGGFIYLQEGTYPWAGITTVDSDPDTYLTVAGFPGTTRDNVIIGSQVGDRTVSRKVKMDSLAFENSSTIGVDNIYYLWFNNCKFAPTQRASIYRNVLVYFTNNDLLDTYNCYYHYATEYAPRALFRGNAFDSGCTDTILGYTFIGNSGCNGALVSHISNMGTNPQADNWIVAYNTFPQSSTRRCVAGGIQVHGAAIVQNECEKMNDLSIGLLYHSADNGEDESDNVLIWHNAVVGERMNYAYNDANLNDVGPLYMKHWSVKHNICDDVNVVTDISTHTGDPNGSRYGNHSVVHGVGHAGNHLAGRAGAAGSYIPKYNGIYSTKSQGETPSVDPLFTSDGSHLGTGLGGGDYSLQALSPCKGIIPAGCAILPYDINGYERSNTGDGDIGSALSADE